MADYTDIPAKIEEIQDEINDLIKLIDKSYTDAFTNTEHQERVEAMIGYAKNATGQLDTIKYFDSRLSDEFDKLIHEPILDR